MPSPTRNPLSKTEIRASSRGKNSPFMYTSTEALRSSARAWWVLLDMPASVRRTLVAPHGFRYLPVGPLPMTTTERVCLPMPYRRKPRGDSWPSTDSSPSSVSS